jgi:hypothetical protein
MIRRPVRRLIARNSAGIPERQLVNATAIQIKAFSDMLKIFKEGSLGRPMPTGLQKWFSTYRGGISIPIRTVQGMSSIEVNQTMRFLNALARKRQAQERLAQKRNKARK